MLCGGMLVALAQGVGDTSLSIKLIIAVLVLLFGCACAGTYLAFCSEKKAEATKSRIPDPFVSADKRIDASLP